MLAFLRETTTIVQRDQYVSGREFEQQINGMVIVVLEVRQQPQRDAMRLEARAGWTARICVHNGLPVIGLITDFLSHLNAIFSYHLLYCDRTIFLATYVFKLRYCYASHLRSLFQSLRLVFYFTLLILFAYHVTRHFSMYR